MRIDLYPIPIPRALRVWCWARESNLTKRLIHNKMQSWSEEIKEDSTSCLAGVCFSVKFFFPSVPYPRVLSNKYSDSRIGECHKTNGQWALKHL